MQRYCSRKSQGRQLFFGSATIECLIAESFLYVSKPGEHYRVTQLGYDLMDHSSYVVHLIYHNLSGSRRNDQDNKGLKAISNALKGMLFFEFTLSI
jgi:hypothetical protein